MKNSIMINEMMSIDELDMVNGGTYGEYKELANLLPKISCSDEYIMPQDIVIIENPTRKRNPDEVASWLKEKLGIDAKIDIGGWWNPLNSAGKSNVYSRNGQNLSHSKVISEINNHI